MASGAATPGEYDRHPPARHLGGHGNDARPDWQGIIGIVILATDRSEPLLTLHSVPFEAWWPSARPAIIGRRGFPATRKKAVYEAITK